MTARAHAAEHALTVVWICWLALLLNQAVESAITGAPVIVWAARLLPLLLFVPGMVRGRPRSFIWLCFVCLLYFITGVEKLFANPADGLAIYGMISVVLLFIAAALHVRWQARANRAAPDQQTPESTE